MNGINHVLCAPTARVLQVNAVAVQDAPDVMAGDIAQSPRQMCWRGTSPKLRASSLAVHQTTPRKTRTLARGAAPGFDQVLEDLSQLRILQFGQYNRMADVAFDGRRAGPVAAAQGALDEP
jgi:hypothetical protein